MCELSDFVAQRGFLNLVVSLLQVLRLALVECPALMSQRCLSFPALFKIRMDPPSMLPGSLGDQAAEHLAEAAGYEGTSGCT